MSAISRELCRNARLYSEVQCIHRTVGSIYTVQRVSIHNTVYILQVQSAQCKVKIGLLTN